MMFKLDLTEVQQQELDRVLERFFKPQTIVRYRVKLEGNEIADDGVPVLGLRAGPSVGVSNLIHEMSHFVEIDQRRMARHGWGLQCKSRIRIPGHGDSYEFRGVQHIEREVRVWAFQWNLMQALGVACDIPTVERLVQPVAFLDNFERFGTTERDSEPYSIRNSKAVDRVADAVSAALADHSVERFEAEWWRRNEVLRRRLLRRPKLRA